MSSIEQINTLLETLSFSEKLSLNERIATAIRKEGGGAKGKGGKTAKAKSKGDADGEEQEKPKRKAAAGTLAWGAFVKHIKTTQPDIFDGVTKESDKLVIVKGVRAEDMAAYDSFVAEWKDKYAASEASASASSSEEAEEEAPVEEAPPPKKETAIEKLAKLKAVKAAAAPSVKAAPVKAPPAPLKEAKPVKKAVKAASAKPKATEEPQMAQKEIDGKSYWHDPETQGLWEVTGETFAEGSSWSGYYQADNEDEPIRYTENFGDE